AESGASIVAFRYAASSRIHVPHMIRNAGGASNGAPLTSIGVRRIRTPSLFIDNQRADALVRRHQGKCGTDERTELEIVRHHRAGLCRLLNDRQFSGNVGPGQAIYPPATV